MSNNSIRSSVLFGFAIGALSALTACADLSADDPQAAEGESEIAEQRVTEPSGDNIKIENVTATGTGCPAGTWTYDPVPEGNAFNLSFTDYTINQPATQTKVIKSLPCTITLTIKTPKTLSYAITSFQYFGYANIAAGMKASVIADYAWTGVGVANNFKSFRYDIPTPWDENYKANDDIVVRGTALSWAPCDITSKLQVRSRLTLESSDKVNPAIFTMDNVDARAQAALKITFRTGRCPTTTSAGN